MCLTFENSCRCEITRNMSEWVSEWMECEDEIWITWKKYCEANEYKAHVGGINCSKLYLMSSWKWTIYSFIFQHWLRVVLLLISLNSYGISRDLKFICTFNAKYGWKNCVRGYFSFIFFVLFNFLRMDRERKHLVGNTKRQLSDSIKVLPHGAGNFIKYCVEDKLRAM